MQVLAYQGTLTYRSLGFYCTRFGVEVEDAVTRADIGVAAGEWSAVHDHVRADVAKTTALARRVGVLTREDRATTTGPCDGLTLHEGMSPLRTGSTGSELAFPKPFPQVFERQARRACQQARERQENISVTARSGGAVRSRARRKAVPEGRTRNPPLVGGPWPARTGRQRPGDAQGAHVCRPPSLDGPSVDRGDVDHSRESGRDHSVRAGTEYAGGAACVTGFCLGPTGRLRVCGGKCLDRRDTGAWRRARR